MSTLEVTDLVIRPVTDGDLAVVTGIYADAVTNGTASFELTPPDEAEMHARCRALVDKGFPYVVAVEAGTLVGYAYAGPYRPRPAYRHTVEDSIYLRPGSGGRGIGRALLDRLIADTTTLGFRQMMAVIGDSRRSHASIRLHRSAGFHFAGTLHDVGFKHGRWLDTVLMQRPLGDGAVSPPVQE